MNPSSIGEVGAALLLPPRDLTVSQWADENRVLTGAASAERGQWRTRPFQREPMDVLSPSHPSKMVILLSAAQMLKTECLLNFLGFIADVDPGPALVVEPRIEDAKALSKDRVAPMFRSTPVLRGKLATVKSRDSDNTVLHKAFTNGSGHVTFTGAISPSGLAMRPIRYVLLDEVDRYPQSAGTEGDPVSLAIQRTAEFEHNKKVLLCSTPTIKGCSRIELAWLQSDQCEYFVPCPHCGEFQVLELGDGTASGLCWPEGHPEEARYRCAHCTELIYDRVKVKEPGPGHCHFPLGRDLEYFEQLTAEKKYVKYHNGFPKYEWRKKDGARNEALDCRVYAYAALKSLGLSGSQLNQFCDRFGKHTRRQPAAPQPAKAAEEPDVRPASAPAAQRSDANPFLRGGEGFLQKRNWFGR